MLATGQYYSSTPYSRGVTVLSEEGVNVLRDFVLYHVELSVAS